MATPLGKQLLLGGADIISDPNRWISHTVRKGNRFCALGAMIEYGRTLGLNETEVRDLAAVICPFLVVTNDNAGREAAITYMRERAATL